MSLTEIVKSAAFCAGLAGVLAAGCNTTERKAEDKAQYSWGKGLTDAERNKIQHDDLQILLLRTNRRAKDIVFALHDYTDLNNNDNIELEELEGVGETLFKKGDGMGFCLYNNSQKGEIRFLLRDLEGKVYRDNRKQAEEGAIILRGIPKGMGYGEYVAEWYRNGALVGMTHVEVWKNPYAKN